MMITSRTISEVAVFSESEIAIQGAFDIYSYGVEQLNKLPDDPNVAAMQRHFNRQEGLERIKRSQSLARQIFELYPEIF